MIQITDILYELERVNLQPILVPVLKATDPLMGSLPKGSVKAMIAQKGTQDGLVKTVEGLAPHLPSMVRFAGHMAESRLAAAAISIDTAIAAPLMRLFAPVTARLLVPSVGPSLKLTNMFLPAIPLMVRISDSLLKVELSVERVVLGRRK